MKRNLLFILSLTIVYSVLFNACKKDENTDINSNILSSNAKIAESQIVYNYILDGVNYPIVMQLKEDSTFEVAYKISEKLSTVLDLPNSTLLKDPFAERTYFVFRSEKESLEKNKMIIQKMNEFEIKFGSTKKISNLKSGVVGSIVVYLERDFSGEIPSLSPLLISDGGYSYVGKYNDWISSYRVYLNTTGVRADEKRYVIRFYEDAYYGGHVLTAYGDFANWESGGDIRISWEDANLHGTLMTGGIFGRKYWGDNISSFKWNLE
jgi:hypothetical protein